MDDLPDIPLIDIRGGTLLDLASQHPERARALVRAAMDTFGWLSRSLGTVAMPLADRASRAWLVRSGNPYLSEIDAVAEILRIDGVYFLNLCFEWGCTSGVWQGADGPMMRRVLDWRFPDLGTGMVVAHQSGRAGAFYNITWPGMIGSFQGLAPGRFAAAINLAPMRGYGYGMIGDWLANRIHVRDAAGLPPAHLLRQVFDTAMDYDAALAVLRDTRLAVPAIFLLSGTEAHQGCVIERTETKAEVRKLDGGAVCATNQFESDIERPRGGWRARPIDSPGRFAAACALSPPDGADDFAWFTPPIANLNSRLAFVAHAASGRLALMGTDGERPVTRIFRLGTGLTTCGAN